MTKASAWKRVRFWAILIVLIALGGAAAWLYALYWQPPRDRFPRQGIDVSAETGPVQWFAVKDAHPDFVYVRATMGSDGRDAQFAANWAGLYQADLPRGAIHAYSLCRLAEDQAANFVQTVPRTDDALPAAVSFDFDPQCTARPDREVLLGEISRFVTAVEAHTGAPVFLKVSPAFERQYELTSAVQRPLWCERLYFEPDYAARPCKIWQASTFRPMPGISGPFHWDAVRR